MTASSATAKTWTNNEVARRIAADIPDGAYVNLGIGMPENVANFIPAGKDVVFHSENGLLGMGPAPSDNARDYDLVNAGKKPVTQIPGGAYFHHADSFAMIRGGHIDVCVLGALQVAENGDLANWSTGAKDAIPGVGGAMDLAAGSKAIYVLMSHTTKTGEPKLVREITYPATSRGIVSRIYTELAVIDVTKAGLRVREMAPGLSFEDLQKKTGAALLRP
jgi:3-oxoadipate CoA-transferase, beta subunit